MTTHGGDSRHAVPPHNGNCQGRELDDSSAEPLERPDENPVNVQNRDPRVACALVVDVSSSMSGAPIAALAEGYRAFIEPVQNNPLARKRAEISVITFGSSARVRKLGSGLVASRRSWGGGRGFGVSVPGRRGGRSAWFGCSRGRAKARCSRYRSRRAEGSSRRCAAACAR